MSIGISPGRRARLRAAALGISLALVVAGCGGAWPGFPDGGQDAGADGANDGGDSHATWVKPAGYASVTFFIDDTANRTYSGGELFWMGTFIHDPATNIVTYDANWGVELKSYPLLFDDGPIASGGHEMPGASAGDHIFSTEVYLQADPVVDSRYSYGALNAQGNWIWKGPNGEFVVPAHGTDRIQAAGLFIDAFGTYDLRLVLDTGQLDPVLYPFDPASGRIAIRGSMIAWAERELRDDGDLANSGDELAGDGRYSYLHSAQLGPHDGLLNGEQRVQFELLVDSKPYRRGGALPNGISARTDCSGSFEPAPIFMEPDPRSQDRLATVVICESAGRLPVGAVIPPMGSAGGGIQVAIYGDGFAPDAQVFFGARPAFDPVWISPGQINCRTPAGDPGPVSVRVNNPDGEFGELVGGFEYTQRMGPQIRHVQPARGPTIGGGLVSLSGVRFADAASVRFGGLAAADVQVLGPRRLTCSPPAHAAGTVSVSLANPDGTSTVLEQAYEYSDQPDRQVDWAGLIGPGLLMLRVAEQSPPIVARVFELELTRHPGCHQEIQAQLGWGPTDSSPLDRPADWTWEPATCQGDCPACGESDEYQGWLPTDLPGEISYALRFSRDAGQSWTLADLGAGSRDGFDPGLTGWLAVLGAGEQPLVRSLDPAAGSLLGGGSLVVTGEGFAPDSQLWLGDIQLATTLVDPDRIEATMPAHPLGPVDLMLIQPEPDYRELSLPGAYNYVLRASPQIDGVLQAGEWPEAFLAAENPLPSDWGANGLQALWVAFDSTELYLAVQGWADPAIGNAIVLFIDTDYGAGSGVVDGNALIDELGYEELTGLDPAVACRFRVLDPAFGAEFALGSAGLASVAVFDSDPRVRALAGLRALRDTEVFGWVPASLLVSNQALGEGAFEAAVPWSSLYPGGLPAAGVRLAIFARLVNRDGEYMSSASLPPDDPAAPGLVESVFVFEAR